MASYLDFDRTFVDADGRLRFGKYRSESLRAIADADPGYLGWALKNIQALTADERSEIATAVGAASLGGAVKARPPVGAAGKAAAVNAPPIAAPSEWRFADGHTPTSEQQTALVDLHAWANAPKERRGSMRALTGYGGTGKTTLLRALAPYLPGVHLAAMTGKAALRLAEVTKMSTSTLHSVLYDSPSDGIGGPVFSDVREPLMRTLVVDEASMLTPRIYMDLQRWVEAGVRILLVGDPFQLPPILSDDEAASWGADFTVFAQVQGPTLTQVMRSTGAVLAAATHLRATQRVPTKSDGDYQFKRVADPVDTAIYDYCFDPNDHVLITWRNEVRMRANVLLRRVLGHTALLPSSGEPVLIRQNTAAHLNGEIVRVAAWSEGPTVAGVETLWLTTQIDTKLLVFTQGGKQFFDGARPYIPDWAAWRKFCREPESRPTDENGMPVPMPIPVTYGYVLTAHAAQGSEYRRVTVLLGAGDSASQHFNKPTELPLGAKAPFSARFLYTALTRARETATMLFPTR